MRKQLFRIIQPSDGYWPSRVFDLGIMALILVSVFSVFAETFELPVERIATIERVELWVSIVFTIEYLLRGKEIE